MLHDPPYLVARIFCVPFIEQILHWNNVAHAISGVDVVHDGDIADVQSDKIFFQKLPHHKADFPNERVRPGAYPNRQAAES